MPKPTASILIPSYNSAPYLRPLCESIQSQTFPDFEAIIWDDGSTDNTSEVIQPFLQDRRFQLLKAPRNQGVGKSWAALLARMQGEYWCAPGSDDVLHRDFLERRVAHLSTHPAAVMVHGPPVFIDAEGRERPDLSVVANPPTLQSGQDALIALLQHNYINQPSTLIRVSSTRRVLSRWRDDWKYAQEWHLWILLAALDQDFLHDPVPAHQYRVHERSLTHLKGHDVVRRLEVRLVPLVAAATAADFQPPIKMMAGDKAVRVESPGWACPCWADMDGDGKKDLLVGQFSGGRIRVYRNLGDGKLAAGDWLKADGAVAEIPGVW